MIACTAHVDENIIQEAKEKGFDEVYQSPMQSNDIYKIINLIKNRDRENQYNILNL